MSCSATARAASARLPKSTLPRALRLRSPWPTLNDDGNPDVNRRFRGRILRPVGQRLRRVRRAHHLRRGAGDLRFGHQRRGRERRRQARPDLRRFRRHRRDAGGWRRHVWGRSDITPLHPAALPASSARLRTLTATASRTWQSAPTMAALPSCRVPTWSAPAKLPQRRPRNTCARARPPPSPLPQRSPLGVTPGSGGATPSLTLNNGATALFTGTTPPGGLMFMLTVAAGTDTSDLVVTGFNSNGATVRVRPGHSALPSQASPLAGTASPSQRPTLTATASRTSSSRMPPTGSKCCSATGSGGFAAPVTYATGDTPVAVTVADLNDDGRLDLIETDTAGRVVVRLANGSGGFGRSDDLRGGDARILRHRGRRSTATARWTPCTHPSPAAS